MKAFIFLFDDWSEYVLKIIFSVGTIGRAAIFVLQFLLLDTYFIQKRENTSCSRNPFVVTFHAN